MIHVWTDEDHLGRLRDEETPHAIDCSVRAFLHTLCGRRRFESENDLRTALEGWPDFVAHDHVHHLRKFRWRERIAGYWLRSTLMITNADEIALYVCRRNQDEVGVIVVAEVEGLPEQRPGRVPPLQRALPFVRPI